MSSFIEEFYYGNIDPQARSFEKNKAVQRSMQTLSDNEEYLTKELEGESLQKFLDLVNAWSLVNGESNLDSFITGFRLDRGTLLRLSERRTTNHDPALAITGGPNLPNVSIEKS